MPGILVLAGNSRQWILLQPAQQNAPRRRGEVLPEPVQQLRLSEVAVILRGSEEQLLGRGQPQVD